MHNVLVSPLDLDCCEAVAAVASRCLPEHLTYEMLVDVLKYDHNHFFVVKNESSDVIGFCGIMMIVDEAELLYIAIDDAYRRQGIGRFLLHYAIDDAKQNKAYRMLLEVRKENATAISMYENTGFHTINIRENYYNNPVDDALIMEYLF